MACRTLACAPSHDARALPGSTAPAAATRNTERLLSPTAATPTCCALLLGTDAIGQGMPCGGSQLALSVVVHESKPVVGSEAPGD